MRDHLLAGTGEAPMRVGIHETALGRSYVVFDLDGCLSDPRHRRHLAPNVEDDDVLGSWDAFNLAAGQDPVVEPVAELLNQLHLAGYAIAIVTGRNDSAWDLTQRWLNQHAIPWDLLLMRGRGDFRSNVDFKVDALGQLALLLHGWPAFWFDDHTPVLEKLGRWTRVVVIGNAPDGAVR